MVHPETYTFMMRLNVFPFGLVSAKGMDGAALFASDPNAILECRRKDGMRSNFLQRY